MKKTLLLLFLFCLTSLFGQQIQSFDTEVDTVYMQSSIAGASNDTLSFVHWSLDEENKAEGAGSMRLDYSVEDAESWGGFAKVYHYEPGSEVYDWSEYDSISFWYNNVSAQEGGEVHLRFNLHEVSDAPDSTTNSDDMEFYYSFHYILDNEAGWNEIKMPLLDGRGVPELDEWGGAAFNRTGWAGIEGNDQLNTDKIKGWALEFSIGGNGDGNVTTGTILIDNMSLKGSKNVISNPGFEDGLTGWGIATGEGSVVDLNTEDAHGGVNSLQITVTDNNWAVAYTDSTQEFASSIRHEWQISAWIKDVSAEDPGGSFAALKLEAKDADGGIVSQIETIADGVSGEWGHFSTTLVIPEGAVSITPVLVGTKWNGNGLSASYLFDDVVLLDLGELDSDPPVAPEGVGAIGDAYFNQVIWTDVPDEAEATYTVYASESAITDIEADGVFQIASRIAEKTQTAVHYIASPLEDANVTWYYAVTCTDKAGNTSVAGVSATGTVNMGKGVAVISLSPPAGFAADGDLSEWYDSDIMPFELAASLQDNEFGTFDDDEDAFASGWVAFDDDYIYMAFDVVDNVFSYDPDGNWWEDDVVSVFIGLYEQVSITNGYGRGAAPDYRFVFRKDGMLIENLDGALLYTNNYNFTDFGASDYAIEARFSLDSLASIGEDDRFMPQAGIRVPFEIEVHDSDATNVRDGILTYSPISNDNSWAGVQNWFHTWIAGSATDIDDSPELMAKSYQLHQNFPNPFNPTTSIVYSLPKASDVRVAVYNVIGQEIAVLVDTKQNQGTYRVNFDAADYTSGIYFYKITAGEFTDYKKMILLK